jgi:hypothetical protein
MLCNGANLRSPEDPIPMPDATAALRQAIEVVRAQIPKGELTLASVQRLLETAETICRDQEGTAALPPQPRPPARQSLKRLEERRKWARIAKEAEREAHLPPATVE